MCKDKQSQNPLNPPCQGEDNRVRSPPVDESENAPPLTRGGREGLGFIPYKANLTEFARANRKTPTSAERKIWHEVLRMRQLADYKFLRQKPIGRFIVDFYCSSLHLVIEIDGDDHAGSIGYDAERTRVLSSCGLTVIRYSNHEVMHNISGVYENLVQRIAGMSAYCSKTAVLLRPV
ncbi:MAG: endonuclease domain-containing protein [Gallionella sp.]|nr:endonuclease domain-containing protein [Gallionella sp.]